MRRLLSRSAAACLAALLVAGPAAAQQAQPAPQAQQPREVLKATHGAWEIHCVEGTETCVMQQVGKTADGKRAMLVMVQRLAGVTAEGKPVAAAMTVHSPLGVLIPYGIRIRVDQGDVSPVPLMRCVPESCVARAPMMDEAVNMLKRGSTAKFGFFLDNEVLVDISLNGFTAAYDALKPVQAQNPAQSPTQ